MASLVNPFNINGNYPIAGQDNDSQGFRDNFTNIKNNFFFIKNEVEDLQSKVVLKSALTGGTLDNNFLGSQLKNVQVKNLSETVYDWGDVGSATTTEVQLDLALGNIHKLQATGSIKINAVIKNWPSSLQYSRLMLYISIDDPTHTLELPTTLTTDLSSLPGHRVRGSSKLITFTDAGDYIFEFSSVDSGTTIFVRELTRGNPVFRDPNFYMAGIGTYSTPTLRLGWGNLIGISTKIDSTTKSGADTFSVRGSITSFQNLADGSNDPASMMSAGFSVAKSRTVDPGAGGALVESVVNTGDLLGYFNGIGYTKIVGESLNSYQSMGALSFYAVGSSTDGLGGNIVISTKRDGGAMAAAITVDNSQNVVIFGDLTVQGNTTTINTTVLDVEDKNITLAKGVVLAADTDGAGISIDNVYANITYSQGNDRWNLNKATNINVTTSSTDSVTGALVVAGGVGIGGALNVGGTFGLTSTTEATTTTLAAFAVSGGIASAKNIIAGGNLFANATTTATSATTGALQVAGGAGVAGNLYVAGGSAASGLRVTATTQASSVSTGAVVVSGGVGVNGNVYLAGASSANGVVVASTLNTTGLMLTESNATARSNTSALRVVGGSLLQGNLVVGIGSGTSGRVFIDNGTNATLGDVKTGGLVLGNATSYVGMSITGEVNIGTDNTGSVLFRNKEASLGTQVVTAPTPYEVLATNYGSFTTLGGANIFGNLYIGQPSTAASGANTNNSGNVYVQSGTPATSFNTGAVVIQNVLLNNGVQSKGGMGIAGNLWVDGNVMIGSIGTNTSNVVAVSTRESTATNVGALVAIGGVGIGGKLNVGGIISANATTEATSVTSGAFVTAGGIGVGKTAVVANLVVVGTTDLSYSLFTMTGSGQSFAFPANKRLGVLDTSGGGTIAAATVTLPAAVSLGDGQLITIGANATVTALTISPAVATQAPTGGFPTTISPGTPYSFIWVNSLSKWVRV